MKQKKTETEERAPKKNFRPRKQPTKPKQSASKSKENLLNSEVLAPTTTHLEEKSAPLYELPEKQTTAKPISFSRIVPNDDILVALEKASYQVPSELLLTVLPATLRGSDTLIYKAKQQDGFLIGVIPAISKILYAEDSEKKESQTTALFLFASEESAQEALALTKELFKTFKIDFEKDILFTTAKSAAENLKENNLKLNHLKLLCVHELHLIDGEEKEALQTVIAAMPERTQKIFISYQQSPKIREFAFRYLDEPEIFSFLPVSITEQQPRQFAHALEATKKFQVLLGYLKTYKPRAALVVANSRTVAEWIAFKLHGNGIKVSLLTSPVSPHQNRAKLLNSVANNEINVFVTTDFALKNFSIENINCVYHFDLPENPQTYLERVSKVEGSRNPISIAFICEDYGFNMGKIEDTLGFKVRLTTPDKNFFHFKDVSEYPLESSGRVKVIGAQSAEAKQDTKQEVKPAQQVLPIEAVQQTQQTEAPQTRTERPERTERTEQRSEARTQQQHPRQKFEQKQRPASTQSSETQDSPQPQQRTSRHHQPDTSKFVRRDERAREAVADAVLAAKMAGEKRKQDAPRGGFANKSSHQQPSAKQDGFVSSLFFVVSEALRAGIHATKESLAHNTEEKFPALNRFLNRKKRK